MPHSLILISLLLVGCGTKDDTPDVDWSDDESSDGWGDDSTDSGSASWVDADDGDDDGGDDGGDDGDDDGDDDGGDSDDDGGDSDDDGGDSDDDGGDDSDDDGGDGDDDDDDDDGETALTDCDDEDPSVYTGADDSVCDGIDNDCDGWVDSDWSADPYEPNDIEGYILEDIEGTTVVINDAFLHPSIEADVYRFYVEDGWFDWFNISAEITDVPGTVDVKLQLIQVETEDGESGYGEVDESDETGLGGDEEVSVGEGWFFDAKSGWYEVVVTSTDGSSCSQPYTLTINADTR
jgi:hypothetical protein